MEKPIFEVSLQKNISWPLKLEIVQGNVSLTFNVTFQQAWDLHDTLYQKSSSFSTRTKESKSDKNLRIEGYWNAGFLDIMYTRTLETVSGVIHLNGPNARRLGALISINSCSGSSTVPITVHAKNIDPLAGAKQRRDDNLSGVFV